MATHSSVLAWRIPETGEPGGLPSMGSHRIGHCRDLVAAAVAGLSLVVESRDHSPAGVCELLIAVASLVAKHRL